LRNFLAAFIQVMPHRQGTSFVFPSFACGRRNHAVPSKTNWLSRSPVSSLPVRTGSAARTNERENNAMNEIAQLLQERFGLSPDQAQEAERAILGLIQSKVPTQFQGIVSSFFGNAQPAATEGHAAPASGGLGGLLNEAEGFLGSRNG
jgi:hypothetical protein